MKFHIYQDARGEWRWRLKARNGRIVADSGEGYVRKAGALRACRATIRGVTLMALESAQGDGTVEVTAEQWSA